MAGFDGYLGAFRHGGFCCGMTHIYGFHQPPSAKLAAVKAVPLTELQDYIKARPSYWGYFNGEYPAQTAGERLLAVLHLITRGGSHAMGRKGGIIEVVLTPQQDNMWRETLEGLGFVNAFAGRNSNTGHKLSVFLLDTDDYVSQRAGRRLLRYAKAF